ncbi:MAG: hypothetical protein A2086_10795 [Spirochaetes bacterium GWD1_27_9]|nr:MAG: hypothetical protein A2Z98_18345 [Spirochaetes bacterium GWB1_27_13]OHD28278.1 MAG: hypothetical protein A2Y34_09680 [Spirochaetes bacterium GWC1_27_15]OHD35045.1 MAG: hypothetical protein A2086_10795 [Spirochaetes bacterium GWD1_27_9]
MFKKILSKNLRKPSFLFGNIIQNVFDANITVYEESEKYIDFNKIENAFEIGYGPGYGIRNYCSKYKLKIDGIDFSKAMYFQAKKRNLCFIKQDRVKLFYGDFENYTLNEKKYDIVYLFNIIYFIKDIDLFMTKILSMLNENGVILIFMDGADVLAKNNNIDKSVFIIYEVEKIISTLQKNGFKNIKKNESTVFKGSFFLIGIK